MDEPKGWTSWAEHVFAHDEKDVIQGRLVYTLLPYEYARDISFDLTV